MCIPRGAGGSRSNGYVDDTKPKKHVKKVPQDIFEKGDPNFVDERKSEDEIHISTVKSLCDKIFGSNSK